MQNVPLNWVRGVGLTLAGVMVAALGVVGMPAIAATNNADLVTWDHPNSIASASPIPDDLVRKSEFYDVSVMVDSATAAPQNSFVYMSVPRSGKGKVGYTDQDGAEYSSDAALTMSWSSFEYASDIWVEVSLKSGQSISSVNEVTIRPTHLNYEKELVNSSTVKIKVPHQAEGARFSVEFDPQLITAYNDMSGTSGVLTTQREGNRAIHTEPQNSLLIFANPILSGPQSEELIPTEQAGSIYRPQEGLVNNLNDITEEIIYFEPGTYFMGSKYHALLPANVKWVYLAPGAYVKGAFRFFDESSSQYKVTGRGVLSGEQYVYEPDTTNDYDRSTADNCHSTCVKMLQFESSEDEQALQLEGITINEPPYHSFVVYSHDENGVENDVQNFRMNVSNYKQVGSWYWQTDGVELYSGSQMNDTFFHANDDVLKMYHSDVEINDTVIWKNENGPVIQWGWTPREIDNVKVQNTDVIHNRMYWKDTKYNTCIFNSSTHWEDMNAMDRADTSKTIKNMSFVNTRVEGMVNCGIRIFALSNTENIEIDGFSVDEWNGLDPAAQVNQFRLIADSAGSKVTVGDEMRDGLGLKIHNYSVGGTAILKSGDNWADYELGRVGFDGDVWENWNITSDNQPIGQKPTLVLKDLADGDIAESRKLLVQGQTDAVDVTVRVNGKETKVQVENGSFSAEIDLPEISNKIVVVATSKTGVMTVERRTITALGTHLGTISDPEGDDFGPGSYRYPTDTAFNPGSFDLTDFDVFLDGDLARFVASTAGEIRNPWGGEGMSTQRLNIYLQDGDSSEQTPMLPGTNTFSAGNWKYVIVVDGRYQSARFGAGVYNSSLDKVGGINLEVDPAGKMIASVPIALLGDTDFATVGYQVSLFSGAEESEGLGGVRPVYSSDCDVLAGCPDFIGAYRFTGGAGTWTDGVLTYDTDTRDSNAIDVMTGAADQTILLDWERGDIVVPYVTLERKPDPGIPMQPLEPAAPIDPVDPGTPLEPAEPIEEQETEEPTGSDLTEHPKTGADVTGLIYGMLILLGVGLCFMNVVRRKQS